MREVAPVRSMLTMPEHPGERLDLCVARDCLIPLGQGAGCPISGIGVARRSTGTAPRRGQPGLCDPCPDAHAGRQGPGGAGAHRCAAPRRRRRRAGRCGAWRGRELRTVTGSLASRPFEFDDNSELF